MDAPGCAQVHGLNHAQIAALQFHGHLSLRYAGTVASCPWLIVDADALDSLPAVVDMKRWTQRATLRRLNDDNDDVLLFRRNGR